MSAGGGLDGGGLDSVGIWRHGLEGVDWKSVKELVGYNEGRLVFACGGLAEKEPGVSNETYQRVRISYSLST